MARRGSRSRIPDVEVELLEPVYDDDVEKAIAGILGEEGCMNVRELKERLNERGVLVGEDRIRRALRRLAARGLVCRNGRGRYSTGTRDPGPLG